MHTTTGWLLLHPCGADHVSFVQRLSLLGLPEVSTFEDFDEAVLVEYLALSRNGDPDKHYSDQDSCSE